MREKFRLNMDVDKELWRQVSVRCAELGIEKREFVDQAMRLALAGGRTEEDIITTKKNELVDALNSYEGDNVWEDVIHQHDNPHGSLVDWEATEEADPSNRSDIVILVDGTTVEVLEGEG